MKTKVLILLTAFAAGAAYAYDPLKFERELGQLVKREHDGAYYFEKQGFDGSWIPTALVFGYPNNAGACDFILQAAATADPQLSFRCRAAN